MTTITDDNKISNNDETEDLAKYLLTIKRKKKIDKSKDLDTINASVREQTINVNSYAYTDLLTRLYDNLQKDSKGIDNSDRKTHTFAMPKILRIGRQKSAISNFKEICRSVNRPCDHIQRFILEELHTTGSINENGAFLIHGVYRPMTIEALLRKYIKQYILCHQCYSANTTAIRDNVTRLHTLHCSMCKASITLAK